MYSTKSRTQKRSPSATQSSHGRPFWKVLPFEVKQYVALAVAWQTLLESQHPEQVVGQLLLAPWHVPETHPSPLVVQFWHAPPVTPHAVSAVPATQLLPWQHPPTQVLALHVPPLSGTPPPESTGPASAGPT
jgi:hypothetical protein